MDRATLLAAGNASILSHGRRLTHGSLFSLWTKKEPTYTPPPPIKKDITYICLWEGDTNNGDGECGYNTTLDCSDCIFVVQQNTTDRRCGKRPWSKCNQQK